MLSGRRARHSTNSMSISSPEYGIGDEVNVIPIGGVR
jgi:hypothetical protein